MRRSTVMCVLMMTLVLTACGGTARGDDPREQALAIRAAYLAADSYAAKLDVTADYGQRVYTYSVDVTVAGGESVLAVTAPAELAGITARLVDGESQLEYDGAVLETGPLSADGLTPLGAVPALLECVRSGFIDNCGVERLGERDTIRVLCRDPERTAGQGREITLWFDVADHTLIQGEVAVDGHRVVLCEFQEFVMN
ncbi:MAG: hypothetical protein IKB79_02135 [Oscillospiraceae bacterium]|nr:hypothetical protein [Oscillospiraceae bacterium]